MCDDPLTADIVFDRVAPWLIHWSNRAFWDFVEVFAVGKILDASPVPMLMSFQNYAFSERGTQESCVRGGPAKNAIDAFCGYGESTESIIHEAKAGKRVN